MSEDNVPAVDYIPLVSWNYIDQQHARYRFKKCVVKVIENRRAYNTGGSFNMLDLAKKLKAMNDRTKTRKYTAFSSVSRMSADPF